MPRGSIDRRRGKKGTTFRVRIPAGYNPDGTRRVISETFRTRREAEEFRTRTLHDLRSHAYIEPSTVTLDDYFDHWLASLPPETRDSSRVTYRSRYRNIIRPTFGATGLRDINPADIQRWYNAMQARYATETLASALMVFRSLLKQALHERMIATNPASGLRTRGRHVIPSRPEDGRAWSAEQLRGFLAETRDHSDWPLWWVAAHTGLRPGELAALRWQDVDLERRTVSVRATQTVIDKRGTRVRGDDAKAKASIRTIGIDPETVLVLRGQRASQEQRREAVGRHWHDEGLVFDKLDGRAINASQASRRFTRITIKRGYPTLSLQGLRRTHGSILAASGRPLHYIQRRLGHANLATTAAHYLHLLPGTEHDDSEAFSAALQSERVQSVSK